MNRLEYACIQQLARDFCRIIKDEDNLDKAQSIIDSLGLHPVNHGIFAYCVADYDDEDCWCFCRYEILTRGIK